jgi:hypothetical protein
VIRGAEEATMERAIDIGRMCLELSNFVDEVGPKLRRAIIDMLNDDRAEYSLQALTQLQRVILDTVKTLETSQGIQDESEGYTGLLAEPLSEPQLRPKAITGINIST